MFTPHRSPVAFLDLTALHSPLLDQLDKIWAETVRDSSFIGGQQVSSFEAAFGPYCHRTHAIGVANGTDAIELTLQALGIGPGDEVVVPANTFVATAEAVVTVGATPVFVDVDEATLLITADLIKAAVTERTRAVMVVHLYGSIPEMGPIEELCNAHDLLLIEDSAQAHGATHRGRPAGSFGSAATFSFYPGKNLGALGDGGAIVCDDDELASQIRVLANHGRGHHLLHVASGRNSRLDGLQAAVLELKLQHLDEWNSSRREVHARYAQAFADTPVQILEIPANTTAVHHLEVIRVSNRDHVRERLTQAQIGSGIHYAIPCHQQPAFASYAGDTPLSVSEAAAERQLSIPMHPLLTTGEIDLVVEVILGAVSEAKQP